ncbi:zinc finger CCCH domain-containing protein 19 [Striga asiatica]|uniref:Zinc finger CCCH domain-containing protein 19 n=1 Tax=Striga asiatica TaxID=4170 RepID=A0A5A7PZB6_STRAF|nr:zinc finger CCCH domain-containing protein 19 [Striga asiatica]
MVVYQPPVLELPVPIKAYRSVNRLANNKNRRSSRRLTNRLGHQTARAGFFGSPKLHGSLSYAAPRPSSPLPKVEPGFVPTSAFLRPKPKKLALPTQRPSPSFYYADPGPGRLFGKPVPTALTARLACQR